MCIRKRRPTLGERVDERRLHHRMPAEITNPVILVIDGNKEDVGLFIRRVKCERQK